MIYFGVELLHIFKRSPAPPRDVPQVRQRRLRHASGDPNATLQPSTDFHTVVIQSIYFLHPKTAIPPDQFLQAIVINFFFGYQDG